MRTTACHGPLLSPAGVRTSVPRMSGSIFPVSVTGWPSFGVSRISTLAPCLNRPPSISAAAISATTATSGPIIVP